MNTKLTIRLTRRDAENIIAIAGAMRTTAAPFVTRSAALKFALATVAAAPARFVEARTAALEAR